jgi:HlyD family secretion protein
VLARLDPSLFQTQIEQARANLIRAQADVERLKVSLDDSRVKLNRARELSGRQLLPRSDLDSAEVTVRAAEAQLKSAEAQVTQAQASLNQNEVNLQNTVIVAPIDGLVISRSVDVGQTVAASMQAPTLFLLAADLTKMQVVANLDESDVGRIRPKQRVTFRVDAYPSDDFIGTVSQVRLEPKVQQNVVTYATVIDVPNNELKLKPGMTANVNIEIARSANVLRVPSAALRFRPTNDIYTALGQTPPSPGGRGDGPAPRGGNGEGATDSPAPAGPAGAASPASGSAAAESARPGGARAGGTGAQGTGREQAGGGRGRGFAGGDDAARSARLAERMQNLSPDEREQMTQRMRARGMDPSAAGGAGSGRGGGPRGRRGGDAADSRPPTPNLSSATTIDALFGPLPRVESTGRVFVYAENQLQPIRVRLGITDGQLTELLEGDLQEGTEVVTNVTTGEETRPAAGAFPFMGPGGGRGGNFGPGGGGNRGGGGGNRGR